MVVYHGNEVMQFLIPITYYIRYTSYNFGLFLFDGVSLKQSNYLANGQIYNARITRHASMNRVKMLVVFFL